MEENEQSPSHRLSSDAPVMGPASDRFGRTALAARIAAEAKLAPPETGFVIALCGPWGSGKTSIANLAIANLAGDALVSVVRFNPWMFSAEADLVNLFFAELAATLGKGHRTLRKIAERAAGYAGALSGLATLIPVVGSAGAAALSTGEKVIKAVTEEPSLAQRRRELVEALNEFDGRIVVFIDDLDRLTDAEIQQIVKLVKLVGDLPRITYILAFDRSRVEQALGAPAANPDAARARGRNYLEKIVQSRHDVPPLRQATLVAFFVEQIATAVKPYGERRFHGEDWANMLGLSLKHMLRTPRDATRVANAVPAAIELYGDEVALTDLLGLEALRVLEPDVHNALADVWDILVDDRLVIGNEERQRQKGRERMDAVLARGQNRDATRALLGQLFPNAQQTLGSVRGRKDERTERIEKRVATPSVFRAYLHATLDDDTLAAAEVERLSHLIADPAELREALSAIDDRFLGDAISRLLDYKADFRPEHAVEAASVLLELEPRLPEDESPIFTGRAPSSWDLHSLVGHLLLSEPDPAQRAALAIRLAETAADLSSRHRVLTWFGTFPKRERRDRDAEMIDEETTRELMGQLRDDILQIAPEELARERALEWLLQALLDLDPDIGRAAIVNKLQDDQLMLALLAASYGTRKAQTIGEAAVRRTPRIGWRRLVELTDGEWLRQRVVRLADHVDRTELDNTTLEALDLATKIARGEAKADPDF